MVLGLEPEASEAELRSTYLLLIKVWHPDRFQSDSKTRAHAEEQLKAINEAYSRLREGLFTQQTRRPAQSAAAAAPPPRQAPAEHQPQTRRRKRAFATVRVLRLRRVFVSGLFFLASCIAAAALCWMVLKPLDSYLASNAVMGKYYVDARASLMVTLETIKETTWDAAVGSLHGASGRNAAPASAAEQPDTQPEPAEEAPDKRQPKPASRYAGSGILPYITAGLTQDEVEKAAGKPDSASGDELVYGKSELYFTAGRLTGWKIEPTTPMRVKLWPDARVNPDLRSFTVGSSKNEVLAVQGTPTFLSENMFGYGNAEVYFQNNRVVRWKNAQGSVPLRAVLR